jgi:serine/threonine-protein kinase
VSLQAGSRLGAYEIIGLLGAGGMGEVYRARDARLNRDVAVKVLPDALALDAERLARFTREAQLLGSLSHPNIAIVHGFEDVAGVHALVMELVDGATLADRIAEGALPLDEAVPIARQIAEALAAAHEQGVIHRDLKPANIKLRPDGTIKVLDFGLAKMLEPPAASAPSSATLSPTITTPAMTQMGIILGTAAYMPPEQARGRPLDRRSDLWAFGCVLFEMLSGVRAFDGEDATDTIAAVVRAEPPWQALPADLPAPVRLLLQRCLEKDRRKRVGDAAAALFVLGEPTLLAATAAPPAVVAEQRRSPWRTVSWSALGIVAAGVIAGAAVWALTRPDPPQVSRLAMTTSGPSLVARWVQTTHVTITHDGSTVIYVGGAAGANPAIFARRIDSLEPVLLTAQGGSPFVSPDGQWVGFASPGTLRRVAITGGPSIEIGKLDGALRGATWGEDDTIVFATQGGSGLRRIRVGDGTSEVLTKPDTARGELAHVLPRFLPGSRALLFTIAGTSNASAQVAALDLRSSPPTSKILIRGGSDARYVSSGHLVYLAGDSLRAVPFDVDRLEVGKATAVPVLGAPASLGGVAGDFEIADNGTLVYLPAGGAAAAGRTLAWVDRQGREEAISAPPRTYLYPRLSPDGTRVALDIREQENDIWVWDLVRKGFTRVTKDPGLDRMPVWADSEHLFYSSMADGTSTIYRQRADGTGTPERLERPAAGRPRFPLFLAPDGTRLLLSDGTGGAEGADLAVLRLHPDASGASAQAAKADSAVEPLIRTSAGESNGAVSPDGRWLAYQSNESGNWDIYVQPFGAGVTGVRSTVSNAGGTQPRWSHDGRELFFVSPANEMMRVRVAAGTTWSAGPPEKLFDASPYFWGGTGNPYFMYDIARDGRFLLVKLPTTSKSDTQGVDNLIVVQHWTEELKRLVPVK